MSGLTRLALVVAYEGTDFAGWQQQDGLRTVQGELARALSLVAGGAVTVEGSGRTDAGVHATAQVAHADVARIPPRPRQRLGAVLAKDVAVRGVVVVGADFHARRSAIAKTYRYRMDMALVASPFTRRTALHVGPRLDVEAMRLSARDFEGERDYASLQTSGSSVQTTTRRVLRCELEGEPPEVSLIVEGSGFLRQMVRAIAGSLLEVGRGRRGAGWVGEMLVAGDRAAAGPNAPAHGLVLEAVRYPAPWQEMLVASLDDTEREA
jgi:tRNA pseudouridine38-40 synthase